jgi:hypothetical protein
MRHLGAELANSVKKSLDLDHFGKRLAMCKIYGFAISLKSAASVTLADCFVVLPT